LARQRLHKMLPSRRNRRLDAVTKRPGSHAHTVKTICQFLAAGLQVRAGIIVMSQNAYGLNETRKYLNSLGVQNIGLDKVRGIGRGVTQFARGKKLGLTELCGSCWRGSICVSSEGLLSPCIMSRAWNVGSVLESDFESLLRSAALREIRERIYHEVWLTNLSKSEDLEESQSQEPCYPNCNPRCSPSCNPIDCNPRHQCNPDLYCGPCYPGR